MIAGGRKKAKDTKVTAKKKRALERAASSEDEVRAESTAKTPKSTKKQKVNQEKETRKGQKVRSFSSLTLLHHLAVNFNLFQFN